MGGVGEDLTLNTDFFTDKTRPKYTSQPFTLHCNKKFIHAAGDHHGSRQNIRLVRTTSLLTLMFADDTFSLESGDNIHELAIKINAEINEMAVWFRVNKFAVNIKKTKYMIFRMKGKKLDNPPQIFYNENEQNNPDDDIPITLLERYHDNHNHDNKLLGIFLDEHLTLDSHVNFICSKLTRSLYCIKQAKHIIPLRGLKSLYFALIHSHLTYCTLIFNSITSANRLRIEKVQKKAVRIMSGSAYNSHTKPIFKQHFILPFPKLIVQSQLLLCMPSNINTHQPHSQIFGKRIMNVILPSTLGMLTIITCLCLVLKLLKNQPTMPYLLPGMNWPMKLNTNKIG